MNPPTDQPADEHEADVISLRPLLGILAALVVIGLLASWWSWRMAQTALPATPLQPQTVPDRVSGVEQGLILHAHDAFDLRERQRLSLLRYERIPGESAFIHIPIDEAKAAWLSQERQ